MIILINRYKAQQNVTLYFSQTKWFKYHFAQNFMVFNRSYDSNWKESIFFGTHVFRRQRTAALTGSPQWSACLHNNFVKRTRVEIDRGFAQPSRGVDRHCAFTPLHHLRTCECLITRDLKSLCPMFYRFPRLIT